MAMKVIRCDKPGVSFETKLKANIIIKGIKKEEIAVFFQMLFFFSCHQRVNEQINQQIPPPSDPIECIIVVNDFLSSILAGNNPASTSNNPVKMSK